MSILKYLKEDIKFNRFLVEYDIQEKYISRYHEILDKTIREAIDGDKQLWYPLSINRLKKIWEDYMTTGFVRDERGMNDIVDNIIDKIITIDVNTMLLGHSTEDPKVAIEEYKEEYNMDIDVDKIIDKFSDLLVDEHGAYRISDNALIPLQKIAFKLLSADKPEEKLLLVDQILNVVHQRSDIASWFIQGGRSALDQLSGKD